METGRGARAGPAAPSAQEESAAGGLADAVKELAQGAVALAGRLGEMAKRAAIHVDEVIEGAAAVAERAGEMAGSAAALADQVQELANELAGKVADAGSGAVSSLLESAPARGPPISTGAPLIPADAPAPGAPAPGGGSSSGASFSGASGSSNHHDDLTPDDLAVLTNASIVLMQGGKLVPFTGSENGPASAFALTVEHPG